MKCKLTLMLLFFVQLGYGQSTMVDDVIKKIEIGQDTIKAVFDWVTDNVKYDVGKLNDINTSSRSNNTSKFSNEKEHKDYLLEKVIKSKKGVCEDYALLFDEVVKELGYQSYVVEGYTKSDKGKINRSIGHAWNAVKVNGEWKLYDPTWGAGYVEDGKRFVKKNNTRWYDVEAAEMIKTHMPFDPVWQISSTPMTYDEFETTDQFTLAISDYDFDSKIQHFLGEKRKMQMQEQVDRSQEMGEGSRLVEKWRKRLTKNIGIYGITNSKDLLADASNKTSEAVELFNDYVKAKNKQFKGNKYSIANSVQKLKSSDAAIQAALEIYKSIEVDDARAESSLNRAIRNSEKLVSQIEREKNFLKRIGGR